MTYKQVALDIINNEKMDALMFSKLKDMKSAKIIVLKFLPDESEYAINRICEEMLDALFIKQIDHIAF